MLLQGRQDFEPEAMAGKTGKSQLPGRIGRSGASSNSAASLVVFACILGMICNHELPTICN
jgi:hypothetical protein